MGFHFLYYILISIYFFKYETIASRNGLYLGHSKLDTSSVNQLQHISALWILELCFDWLIYQYKFTTYTTHTRFKEYLVTSCPLSLQSRSSRCPRFMPYCAVARLVLLTEWLRSCMADSSLISMIWRWSFASGHLLTHAKKNHHCRAQFFK